MVYTVGQTGGARLQNIRRFHLVELVVNHRRNRIPAGSRHNFFSGKFTSTPGADNNIGSLGNHPILIANNATFGIRMNG